jgi:hypothetical protein
MNEILKEGKVVMYEKIFLFSNWREALMYVDEFITNLQEGKKIIDLYNELISKDFFKMHPGLQDAELLEICHWITDPENKGVDVGFVFELNFGGNKPKYLEMITYSYPGEKPNVPQKWSFQKIISKYFPPFTVQPANLWVKKASATSAYPDR